jgi:hypothetical protein
MMGDLNEGLDLGLASSYIAVFYNIIYNVYISAKKPV